MTTEGIITIAAGSYIKVMGLKKWNSLTDKEKHDVVMVIVTDANQRLEVLLKDK